MLGLSDIAEATAAKILQRGEGEVFAGLSTDSRTINKGELFVALAGPNFDGHDFLSAALASGAGAIISRPLKPDFRLDKDKTILLVDDTLAALQAIARHIRMKRPDMPVVGVTGSNGKTTTKELTALVLGQRFNVLKSSGNFNNQIGLPLNLCRLDAGHGAAVLEMGASRPGDIAELCAIASPTHGIITNVSESHLEGFSGMGTCMGTGADPMRTLIDTKLALARAAGAVIYNADDQRLREAVLGEFGADGKKNGKTLLGFGMNAGAELRAEDIRMEGGASIFRMAGRGQSAGARLPAAGLFNVHNALAAAACGLLFGISLHDAASAMAEFSGVPMRYGITMTAGALILGDVYNANPASMEAAILELQRLRGKRAVAVLGDMLELGGYAEEAHRGLGRRLARLPVDVFIAVGPMMAAACEEFSKEGAAGNKKVFSCADSAQAGSLLMENLRAGDTVLVKGSRGVRMERVLEYISAKEQKGAEREAKR